MTDRALTFDCDGERLVGVLSEPAAASEVGVVVVVGGPQYRAGSHRQFVQLARSLAQGGVATLRFDARGMGDSTGPMQSFESLVPDIAGAIDALCRECPGVRRVVLWGLCDAASAALLHFEATADPRIGGLVLVNPWVRSEVTLAKARLAHYYVSRVTERAFWSKLVRRRVDVRAAAASFARSVATAAGLAGEARDVDFRERMATALDRFTAPVLLILSGRDLTAKEFVGVAGSDPRWRGLIERTNVTRRDFDAADHTFSEAGARLAVEQCTLQWLRERLRAAAS